MLVGSFAPGTNNLYLCTRPFRVTIQKNRYQWTLAGALLCVLAQFWIARGRGRAECFTAFRLNQWVGLAVFAVASLPESPSP